MAGTKDSRGSVIFTAPKRPRDVVHAPLQHTPDKSVSHRSSSAPIPSAAPKSSGGGKPSGGGGKTTDPLAYAKAQAAKQANAAAQRNLDQAATMGLQIKALRLALNSRGFRANLEQKLRNITLIQAQSDADLVHGYKDRVGGLRQTADDNDKAAAGQTYSNLTNRSRERANALSEAQAQGAGESDVLRAQGMALRNWSQNQQDQNRSYFDTLSSINSSLTDLTTDTRTARVNNVVQSNADRDQVYQNYYDRRSETLTNLGNALGQQAEYFGMANEAKKGKARGRGKAASAASGAAFRAASRESGKAYKNPGVSASLRNWAGEADFEGKLNNDQFSTAATEIAPKKPEGATLRKWDS